MLNKELILKVADEIEAMPFADIFNPGGPVAGFSMSDWSADYGCGTVCCIGGHVLPAGSVAGIAGVFGIDTDEALSLCYARGRPADLLLSEILPSQAARVLRHLAETGKVDWSIA